MGTLGFAQRAKKIRNEVRQNIEMGAKEYKYLCDGLKSEIMILRGDLRKNNLPVHIVSDKKLLQFLPQDAYSMEEVEVNLGLGKIGTTTVEPSSSSVKCPTCSLNQSKSSDLSLRKRPSLLNLNEEEFILKYCELKAKYENLLESASSKIQEMTEEKNLHLAEQKQALEQTLKEERELTKKYEDVIDEKNQSLKELENKVKQLEFDLGEKNKIINENNEEKISSKSQILQLSKILNLKIRRRQRSIKQQPRHIEKAKHQTRRRTIPIQNEN